MGRPLVRALIPLDAHQLGDLGLHQRLGEHSDPLAQYVPILLLQQLANERR